MYTSKVFRTSNKFLRNEYESSGRWGIPIIRKQQLDLSKIDLISYSDISCIDTINLHKGVHFFIDDYRFESIYNYPERSLEKLRKYKFLLSPDYSLYADMQPWRQIQSIGKSRWVGAYWQENNLIVVPTISWSTPNSYDYCFDGIEKNSVVAIGMIGCKGSKVSFMKGYNVMLEKIKPEAIICFGNPFEEMKGNIIKVAYIPSRRGLRYGR